MKPLRKIVRFASETEPILGTLINRQRGEPRRKQGSPVNRGNRKQLHGSPRKRGEPTGGG